jgi:hypothetical protein
MPLKILAILLAVHLNWNHSIGKCCGSPFFVGICILNFNSKRILGETTIAKIKIKLVQLSQNN